MAVDSNALTLAQYALMSNEPMIQRIIWSLLELDGVLSDLPLINKKALVINGSRFSGDTLPAVNWSKINEEPVVVNATPRPFQEQVYLIRNSVDTDNKLMEAEGQIVDPHGIRVEAYLRSVRYDINDKFINNNQLTGDPDSFVGLRARLDDPTRYGTESELKINGSGVDLTQGAGTAATFNNFLELVDTLLDYLDASDGNGVVLYMNELLKRRFNRALRVAGGVGGFGTATDNFGRDVTMYRGAKIRVIGRKKDQSTQIITSTEDTAGADGASTYTSLYAVHYGESHFTGWQFDTMQNSVRNLGLLDNGVTYRTVFDWAVGLYQAHTRSIGRIYGIKVA